MTVPTCVATSGRRRPAQHRVRSSLALPSTFHLYLAIFLLGVFSNFLQCDAYIFQNYSTSVRILLTYGGQGTKGTVVDWTRSANRIMLGVADPASQTVYVQELLNKTRYLSSMTLPIKIPKCFAREKDQLLRSTLPLLGTSFKFRRSNQTSVLIGSPNIYLKANDQIGLYIESVLNQQSSAEIRTCRRDRNLGLALAVDPDSENGVLMYSSLDRQLWRENGTTKIQRFAQVESDSYFGFALATRGGIFSASSPRALHGKGLISLYHESGIFRDTKILGDQAGSYFGYSLAIGYLHNKSEVQVAIGNPYWLDMDTWTEDVGAVDIYTRRIVACNNSDCSTSRRKILSPRSVRQGKFGAIVLSVDLNQDGHDDLIIGEPGEGRDFSGAVHIFLYDPNIGKIMEKPHQSLTPAEISSEPARLFGQSVATHLDVDQNGFPDILTSFVSDGGLSVAIFRSRPVVSLTTSIHTPLENLIEQDRKWNCSALRFQVPGCSAVQLCMEFSGDSLKQSEYAILVQMHADYGFEAPRITVVTDDSSPTSRKWQTGTSEVSEKFTLTNRRKSCRSWYFQSEYVAQQTEVMKRVLVHFTFSLEQSIVGASSGLGFSFIPPLLMNGTNYSEFGTLTSGVALQFKNLCGDDQRCQTDLVTTAAIPDGSFTLGRSFLHAIVRIANRMEPAYSARLNVTVPSTFTVTLVDEYNATMQCHPVDNSTGPLRNFTCDVGNPFPGFHSGDGSNGYRSSNRTFLAKFGVVDFKVPLRSEARRLNLSFNVLSEAEMSSEANVADNSALLSVPLSYKLHLNMDAQSHPDQMLVDRESQQAFSDEVTYIYQMKTMKEAGVKAFEFKVTRVNETLNSEPLVKIVGIEANGERLYCTNMEYTVGPTETGAGTGRINKRATSQANEVGGKKDSWFSSFWSQAAYNTETTLDCAGADSPVRCVVHTCTFRLVQPSDVVTLKVKVQFYPQTLQSIDTNLITLVIPTWVDADVTELSYVDGSDFELMENFIPRKNFSIHRSCKFPLTFKVDQQVTPPPPWAFALAIVGGIFLLLCIIVILVYCGFFKRRRPPTAANGTTENGELCAVASVKTEDLDRETDDFKMLSKDEEDNKKKPSKSDAVAMRRKSKAHKSPATSRQYLRIVRISSNGPHQFVPQLRQVPANDVIPEKYLSNDF